MRTKIGVLVVVALVAYGLKRHYADASTDTLSWILTPTAHLVDLVTGVTFTAVPGEGYFSAARMFLIEKACAGVNFMIAAFAMVAFMLLHRVQPGDRARRVLFFGPGVMVLGASLLASYVAAVIVNTVRIVIALWLASTPLTWTSLTAADIHRLEGIAVYFGGLLLLYGLVRWIDSGRPGFSYALPLGCYYLVTLGVPVVNGASLTNEAFLTHALIVLLVPLALMLLVWATRRLVSLYPRRSVSAGSSPHARRAGNHAAAAATSASAPAPAR
jgi:exosortase K